MAGSCTMGAKFLSQWYFPWITQQTQTNQKESSKFLLSGGYGDRGYFWTAKSPRSVQLMELIAVQEGFFYNSLISWNRNPVSRKSLKLPGTCASSCQSFTVNSTLLSSSGVQSKNTCGSIVIIHLKHSRQTFRKPWNQFNSAPYGSGNTG
jgi:hypothetical protein